METSKKLQFCIWGLLFFIILYFCFEYKPIEQRLYHAFYKCTSTLYPFPKYLPFDLHIYLTDLLIIISFILVYWKKAIFFQKEHLFFSLFWVCALFSIFFSPYEKDYSRLVRLHQLFFALLLFATIAKVNQKKFVTYLIFFFLVLGVFESFIALYQYAMQSPLGIAKLGEVKFLKISDQIAKISSNEGKIWRFSAFRVDKEKLFRAYGTLAHPNILACFFFTSIMSSCYFWVRGKKRFSPLFILVIFFQLMALFVTFSRSGLYVTLCFPLIYFFLLKKSYREKITYITCFLLLFSINTYLFYPLLSKRGAILTKNSISHPSNLARVYYNKIAFKMIQKHPLLGVGYDQFTQHVKKIISPKETNLSYLGTVHNIYLLIGAEIGLVGLFCFLSAIYLIFQKAKKNVDSLHLTLFCIFLGYLSIGLVDYFFLFSQQGKILFFTIGALISTYQTKSSVAQNEGSCSNLHSLELIAKC